MFLLSQMFAFILNFAGINASLQCPSSQSLMDSSSRDMILNTVNSYRQQAQKGTLLLDNNGSFALPALNLPNLTWSCELESYLAQTAYNFCYYQKGWDYPNITGGGMDYSDKSTIELATLFSQIEFKPSILTFLSTTNINPRNNFHYLRTHLLHDKATKMACTHFNCPAEGVTLQPIANLTFFFCTFDKIVQENEIIYEIVTKISQ